eukprot:5964677-Ditylum_brightwellii.AAC.1
MHRNTDEQEVTPSIFLQEISSAKKRRRRKVVTYQIFIVEGSFVLWGKGEDKMGKKSARKKNKAEQRKMGETLQKTAMERT